MGACLIAAWLIFPAHRPAAAPALQPALGVSTGYRADDFRWNIAGDLSGANPNILSELSWSGLQIYLIDVRGELFRSGFTLAASLEYGWILAGRNQDSDYHADERTAEYSRSYSDASGGFVLDASVSAGYRFALRPGAVELETLAGLSYRRQGLVMTNGDQVIPDLGPFEGLNSRYDACWGSLWLGSKLAIRFGRYVELETGLAGHLAAYRAKADWNLRSDFQHPVSFIHEAPAYGGEIDLALGFTPSPRWTIGCRLCLEQWVAGPGVDETYFNTGALLQTRLNEVVWRSLRLTGSTTVRF